MVSWMINVFSRPNSGHPDYRPDSTREEPTMFESLSDSGEGGAFFGHMTIGDEEHRTRGEGGRVPTEG